MESRHYSSPPEGDFAGRCDDFAAFAGEALDYLCDPAFNRPTGASIHDDDLQALTYVNELHKMADELYDPLSAADSYIDTFDLVDRFDERWREFRAALPLTEPERYWLTYGCLYDTDKGSDTDAEHVAKINLKEATIVSTGVHKIVNGRVLLQRWLDWRREAGEYRGQGTLDIARHALHDLMLIVDPNAKVPDSYLRLTQQ